MKVETYLVIQGKKVRSYGKPQYEARIVHTRHNKPKLERNQIAVKVEIELADNIFEKIIPVARLEVGERHILQPDIIALDPNDGETTDTPE